MGDVQELNRSTALRFVNAFNDRDLTAVRSCLHPEAVHRARLASYPAEGIEYALKVSWEAMPDIHWHPTSVIAEGDEVAIYSEVTGTHLGAYLGHPGTGNRIQMREIDIARFQDGLVVEHVGLIDELYLLVQLDILSKDVLAQMS